MCPTVTEKWREERSWAWHPVPATTALRVDSAAAEDTRMHAGRCSAEMQVQITAAAPGLTTGRMLRAFCRSKVQNGTHIQVRDGNCLQIGSTWKHHAKSCDFDSKADEKHSVAISV